MEDPFFSFEKAVGYIINILAAIGMVSLAVIIGLYFSGFFTWLLN
jgi:hypothetical protein